MHPSLSRNGGEYKRPPPRSLPPPPSAEILGDALETQTYEMLKMALDQVHVFVGNGMALNSVQENNMKVMSDVIGALFQQLLAVDKGERACGDLMRKYKNTESPIMNFYLGRYLHAKGLPEPAREYLLRANPKLYDVELKLQCNTLLKKLNTNDPRPLVQLPPPPPPTSESSSSSTTTNPSSSTLPTCLICEELPSNVAFQPCGHVAVCDGCLKSGKEMGSFSRCPICRAVCKREPLRLFLS